MVDLVSFAVALAACSTSVVWMILRMAEQKS